MKVKVAGMARLKMRRGPTIGAEYELADGPVTIGRGTKNDIIITDNEVSREHCRLVPKGRGYELQDLGSRTGTFVNGQRVEGSRLVTVPSLIELGDSITLEFDPGADHHDYQEAELPATRELDGLFLVLTLHTQPERTYSLRTETVTIGRDLSNDIVVQDPEVSRLHVRLRRTDDGYYEIEDAGSTNGTFINGQELLGTYLLQFEDVIELAPNAQMRYVHEPETETPSPDRTSAPLNAKKATSESSRVFRPIQPEFLKGNNNTTQLGSGLSEGALVDHIFVSYARADWENIIVPLMVVLQDSGIQAWVEQYLMPGGDDWRAGVEQALRECWLMVLVMSPQAMNSRHVKLQYRYFLNREKPMIPFGYKSVSTLPPEFAPLHIVPYDPKNQSHSFQRLILEIMQKRT
ncbi:MAG: FHA domain-containing protein [Anaerolineae bacterium]|nr:FHA domain-containing protein [Anaerolineae bacterium]